MGKFLKYQEISIVLSFNMHLPGWWMEYALDYCYIQNTYFVPFTDIVPDNYWDIAEHVIPIPKNITEREDRLIG